MHSKRRALISFVRSHSAARRAGHAAEVTIFGSAMRAGFAKLVLRHYFKSLHRRWWGWQTAGEPHFSLHSGLLFSLFEGTVGDGIYSLSRAFYSAEVINNGDVVLDIGCGDGSLTKRFCAPRAAHVDGVDIESSAIAYACRHNGAPNIAFQMMDATRDPFPRPHYNVIIFDGAIGHLSSTGAQGLLQKIAAALAPNGIFSGSESLGREGHDHLQFFDSVDDLRAQLAAVFKHVHIKTAKYGATSIPGGRVEAYWRCAHSREPLSRLQWSCASGAEPSS